jgi:Cu/Ag efflux protein CusF
MKTNKLQRTFLVLAALLVAMPIGWASEVHAQAAPGYQGPPAGGAMQHVEGKIKSMDPSGRMLTLEDGTQLTIPPTVNVPRGSLKEGAVVKASFEEQNGRKIVTSLQVQAGQ